MSRELTTDFINNTLDKLCRHEGVRCLFAVESGSRAWGFASPDSDYDIRFIYIRPEQDYLRIQRPRDVIEKMTPDDLDMVGWDATKALTLLGNSNPSIVEWLATPMVYQKNNDAYRILTDLAIQCFSAKALAMHYLSLGDGHIQKYVLGKNTITLKRYFYALRAVLSAEYVTTHNQPAPIVFDELLTSSNVPHDIQTIIDELLAVKKRGGEKHQIPHIAPINDYITSMLKKLTARANDLRRTNFDKQPELEAVFQKLLNLQN